MRKLLKTKEEEQEIAPQTRTSKIHLIKGEDKPPADQHNELPMLLEKSEDVSEKKVARALRKNGLVIPVMTLLFVASVLLNIPVFTGIVAFCYLLFVPGFVILKLFKLKELDLLKTFLISVGLSLFATMVVALLVNELYVILGVSQPLSVIPLTVAMSTFTLIVFFIGYRRGFSINFVSLDGMLQVTRNHLPLTLVLIILPTLSVIAALYVNVPIMILLCLTISVLCVLSIASNRFIPSKYYPFLIFSISISILLLNLLISKYTIGDDANREYYIFKITQIRGYWGPIDAVTNPVGVISYNSMLSVTLLPNVYSVLMNLKNEMLFKILYSFIFSLVPLSLYEMYKNEVGQKVGLISTFFFVFTLNAFFGELISVNRQIVAYFFLILSLFLWLNKAIPIKEKRILLIIFGASIALSHYSIAIIYLIIIAFVVIISGIKSKFDGVYNAFTVLAIFGISTSWFAFSSGSTFTSTLTLILNTAQTILFELTGFQVGTTGAGVASSVFFIPTVFTPATWINLILSGITLLLLLFGILLVLCCSRRLGISDRFKLIIFFSGIIFAVSYLFPMVARTLNFTRFYAIALLFLSPCFAIGALIILKTIQRTLRKRSEKQRTSVFLNKHGKMALLTVAVLLSAYFFSQSGLINYVTWGDIHSNTFDYCRMKTSDNPQVQIQFYSAFNPEQDVFSAVWLSKYANTSSIVFSDIPSRFHVLASEGLIPENLRLPLTNTTKPQQGSFVYLGSLNVAKGIISVSSGLFNTSEITSSLNQGDLIYSNGNSQIWSGAG